MTELDQIWSQMLDAAAVRARDAGSHEIADYLALKATNDAVRAAGVNWLLDTVVEIASDFNRSLSIERQEPHRFQASSSRMVGTMIQIRHGVRCLNVEAGWTRTPSDGVMLGGALAFARLSHFGMSRSGIEARLLTDATRPFWRQIETGAELDSDTLRRHIEILTA